MFRDAKVGDTANHIYYGLGVIIDINFDKEYPIKIKFNENNSTFLVDGREFTTQNRPLQLWGK